LNPQSLFRPVWRLTNALLVIALLIALWSGLKELYLRQYLKGFSTAIVLEGSSPQQKVETILPWMSIGPQRLTTNDVETPSVRDLQYSLNYQNLLEECGNSTNAFLFLSRSSGVDTRRLLLLTPEDTTKHVVAEVYIRAPFVLVSFYLSVLILFSGVGAGHSGLGGRPLPVCSSLPPAHQFASSHEHVFQNARD
jgi:hypothetical protein